MGSRRNTWKIISVVFIVLFILILLWGLINVRPRYQFIEPTQDQIDMAKTVVANDLQVRGDSIDNYDVDVTNRVVGFIGRPRQGNGRPDIKPMEFPDRMSSLGSNIQVSLRGNSTGYVYIVDLDSEKILMRSFTEWFDD